MHAGGHSTQSYFPVSKTFFTAFTFQKKGLCAPSFTWSHAARHFSCNTGLQMDDTILCFLENIDSEYVVKLFARLVSPNRWIPGKKKNVVHTLGLEIYDSWSLFGAQIPNSGDDDLTVQPHPSANRRWRRSAMHLWRSAHHIHEASYTWTVEAPGLGECLIIGNNKEQQAQPCWRLVFHTGRCLFQNNLSSQSTD